jgi:glycosyltransferase involved in cell wall biosynthesis
MTKTLTIGIPCYNETLTIGKVITDFRAVFPEARLLVIDNASTDNTAEVARAHGAEVVSEPRKGKGYAVQQLFCLTESDYLIMVDGDDTYPAEEALKLIAAIERQGGDTAVGRRTSDEQAAFKMAHTWANMALCRVIELMFNASCGDLFSGYRLFTRAFYRNVPMLAKGFEVETELAIQTIDKGFVQRDVNISFRSRPEGSFSKLNTFTDGFRVMRVLVTVVKDFKPMLFFSQIALFFFLCSIVAGAFPIMDYIRIRYVLHVPLAILATGLDVLAALAMVCGFVLDTIVRYEREQFFLRMRDFKDAPRG